MAALLLLLMLLACGVIASGVVIALMAWGLVHPPRMTDGKAVSVLGRLSPADLGLPFEPITFAILDERGRDLTLTAWWIPAPASAIGAARCAVLLPGYADAKVGVIAWAPVFHAAGLHILALDLRAHGESVGDCVTAGFFERHDVVQVLAQLRAILPALTKQFILFGASSGGAVALAAAANRIEDLAGIILDSPYASFTNSAMANFDRLGLPGRFFQSAALRLVALATGANFAAVAPAFLLPGAAVPVFMILPDSDPIVSEADRAILQRAMAQRANPQDALWLVPDCRHLLALHRDPAEYTRRVRAFLESLAVKHDQIARGDGAEN